MYIAVTRKLLIEPRATNKRKKISQIVQKRREARRWNVQDAAVNIWNMAERGVVVRERESSAYL